MPVETRTDTPDSQPPVVLEARDVRKSFAAGRGGGLGRARISAVDGVSLQLRRGEALGIVGESGCGKSTLARMLVGLDAPDDGEIHYAGQDVSRVSRAERRRLRSQVQMVFQDPYTSLDPRMTVQQIVEEPLVTQRVHADRRERRARVAELLERVGLAPQMMDRYPHQFSGGQRQRIGIARAIALDPKVVVCDEPVSALDVSVQAQVVNLLHDLQESLGLALVFIAHDLSVVRHVCRRTAVMYLGRIAEQGDTEHLWRHPTHPYTQALLSASPDVDRTRANRSGGRIVLAGDPPSPARPPTGCRFHTRCRMADDLCSQEQPVLRPAPHQTAVGSLRAEVEVACHFAQEALDDLATRPGPAVPTAAVDGHQRSGQD